MRIHKRVFYIWLILLLPFLYIYNYYKFNAENNKTKKAYSLANQNVGKPFPFEYIYDTAGNKISPNSLNTDLTIIDLWFEQCPPCIEDMSKFSEMLKGKEDEISILSISVDLKDTWKNLFNQPDSRISFLANNIPGWKHGNIQVSDDYVAPTEYIVQKLKSNHYPGYFVVDKKGIIKEIPVSAIDYINTNFNNQSPFLLYIKAKSKENGFWGALLYDIFFYNGIFWFAVLLSYVAFRRNSI